MTRKMTRKTQYNRKRKRDAALRRQAKKLGIPWSMVLEMYRLVKNEEQAAREHPNEVRSTAWHAMVGHKSGSAPFWRHGFVSRYGRRVDRHDYTVIPGYDVLAQEIAGIFPEYAHDAGTEELFAFLLSTYNRMPSRQTMLGKAIDRAAEFIRQANEPQVAWLATTLAWRRMVALRKAGQTLDTVPF
jgi:hypothetical protein